MKPVLNPLNLTTAALFAMAAWRLGLSSELPAVLAFIFGGVLLSVIDWRFHRLPTKLVYYTLAGVGAGLLFATVAAWDWRPLATAVIGGWAFAGFFFALYFVVPRFTGFSVIGLGDVRLAFILGALLGWYGLEYVLYGVILGHLLAAVIGLAVMVRRRKLLLQIAFGPPLMIGTLAVVLFHQI
jgi:leader peptidase (prepilin peptidase)/N-methyltransferase